MSDLHNFRNFEPQVYTMWNMRRSYAYELIDDANAMRNLSGIPDMPQNPAQVRPLLQLKNEPDQRPDAWRVAVETWTDFDGGTEKGAKRTCAQQPEET